MDSHEFDRLVQAMISSTSRRSVFRRVAGSAVAGPLALLGLSSAAAQGKDKKPKKGEPGGGCRGEGHPCEGNQVCCDGLQCLRSGPGNALRCTGQASQPAAAGNQACPGTCPQTTQTVIVQDAAAFTAPPSYWVETSCAFDAPTYQTICTCLGYGPPGAPRVQKITLPAADICAVVIGEESRPGGEPVPSATGDQAGSTQASAGTGGEANADAGGGTVVIGDIKGKATVTINASGGTADADASGGDDNVVVVTGDQGTGTDTAQLADPGALTLTLAGEVVPGQVTTYWLETDVGRRPAPGPALVQVADQTAGTGAIVAEAMVCDIAEPQADYDWFGQCVTPALGMGFALYSAADATTPVATRTVSDQGRAHFGGLPPGTYQLKPDGTNWCYAESNRADATGGVLVEADTESHIWSFTCGAAGS